MSDDWLKTYLDQMNENINRRFDLIHDSLDSHSKDDSETFTAHSDRIGKLELISTQANLLAKIGLGIISILAALGVPAAASYIKSKVGQ